MSELNEKLQSIKLEKDKLTPDILSKGNTILGVEGSNRSNIKIFESVEDMNNDPDKQQGDKAAVYSKMQKPIEATTKLKTIYLPDKVTLEQGVTDDEYINLMLRSDYNENPNIWMDLNISLNKTMFSIMCFGGDSHFDIRYSSEDGLIYIKEGEESILELEATCMIEELEQERFDSRIGQFVYTIEIDFQGLYEVNEELQYQMCVFPFNITKEDTDKLLPGTKVFGKDGIVTGDNKFYENFKKNVDPLEMVKRVFSFFSYDSTGDGFITWGTEENPNEEFWKEKYNTNWLTNIYAASFSALNGENNPIKSVCIDKSKIPRAYAEYLTNDDIDCVVEINKNNNIVYGETEQYVISGRVTDVNYDSELCEGYEEFTFYNKYTNNETTIRVPVTRVGYDDGEYLTGSPYETIIKSYYDWDNDKYVLIILGELSDHYNYFIFTYEYNVDNIEFIKNGKITYENEVVYTKNCHSVYDNYEEIAKMKESASNNKLYLVWASFSEHNSHNANILTLNIDIINKDVNIEYVYDDIGMDNVYNDDGACEYKDKLYFVLGKTEIENGFAVDKQLCLLAIDYKNNKFEYSDVVQNTIEDKQLMCSVCFINEKKIMISVYASNSDTEPILLDLENNKVFNSNEYLDNYIDDSNSVTYRDIMDIYDGYGYDYKYEDGRLYNLNAYLDDIKLTAILNPNDFYLPGKIQNDIEQLEDYTNYGLSFSNSHKNKTYCYVYVNCSNYENNKIYYISFKKTRFLIPIKIEDLLTPKDALAYFITPANLNHAYLISLTDMRKVNPYENCVWGDNNIACNGNLVQKYPFGANIFKNYDDEYNLQFQFTTTQFGQIFNFRNDDSTFYEPCEIWSVYNFNIGCTYGDKGQYLKDKVIDTLTFEISLKDKYGIKIYTALFENVKKTFDSSQHNEDNFDESWTFQVVFAGDPDERNLDVNKEHNKPIMDKIILPSIDQMFRAREADFEIKNITYKDREVKR